MRPNCIYYCFPSLFSTICQNVCIYYILDSAAHMIYSPVNKICFLSMGYNYLYDNPMSFSSAYLTNHTTNGQRITCVLPIVLLFFIISY